MRFVISEWGNSLMFLGRKKLNSQSNYQIAFWFPIKISLYHSFITKTKNFYIYRRKLIWFPKVTSFEYLSSNVLLIINLIIDWLFNFSLWHFIREKKTKLNNSLNNKYPDASFRARIISLRVRKQWLMVISKNS